MRVMLWILSMVAANLSVQFFGPVSMIPNAFLFVGLDLTLRDRIHDEWSGARLWPRMVLLVVSAGLITWMINRGAGRIAVASSVSLVVSQLADAVVYTMGAKWRRFLRVNGSNVVSATVDSFVFPTLAFGGFIWWGTLGQLVAKVLGGLVWYPIIMRRRNLVVPGALLAFALTVSSPRTAIAQSVESHWDIDREFATMTGAGFHRYNGIGNLFAWADVDINDGPETVYGEASFTSDIGLTVEYNGGVNRDVGEIADFGLVGFEYKHARLLLRTDGEPQVTYYWRGFWHSFEFTGFVDMWRENDKTVVLSEPQLWYRLNAGLHRTSEAQHNEKG